MPVISTGRMIFTETNKPIMGYVIKGSEYWLRDYLIRRRRLQRLDTFRQPNGEEYFMWEVVFGNRSRFFDSKFDAERYCKGV